MSLPDEQCPGSKLVKEPKPEEITCPWCRAQVEIWTDETKATCRGCGRILAREMAQSCLDWCAKADECLKSGNYRKIKGDAG